MTPGAVSQSVKSLEDYLGRTLLSRTPRGLVLCDAAAQALPSLSEGFDRLAEGAQRLAGPERGGRLTVSVAPSFGAEVARAAARRLRCSRTPISMCRSKPPWGSRISKREGVDIAIRYGAGRWAALESKLLLREEVTPVCSPAVAGEITSPDDLARFTLIHDDSNLNDESCPDWPMWLKAAGAKNVDAARGPRFNQSSLAIEAAASGRGVTLAKRALAQADLDAGRLAAPFTQSTPIEFAYWIVHPPGRARSKAARAFIKWATEEAEKYAAAVQANASFTASHL